MEATASLTIAHLQEIYIISFKVRSSWYLHWIHPNSAARANTKQPRAVFDACETAFGTPSAPSEESKSDGERGFGSQLVPCAIVSDKASNSSSILFFCRIRLHAFWVNEIVDAGIDDEAIEVQQSHVVAVGCGPTKLEIEHHVASGHAQHRT